MDYEIIETGLVPDRDKPSTTRPVDWHFVKFRTPGGEAQEIVYSSVKPRTPDEVVQWHLQYEEGRRKARANMPDTINTFGMWVKMDMTSRSHEEIKQAYRDHMDALGYDVDAQMVAHRRQTAQRRHAAQQAVAAKP